MDTETIQSEATATANQVVAANITAMRKRRGWTQEQFAERLETVLGDRWSIAVVSAAERSVTGKRVREFTADELVALARTFEVPIGSLFQPRDAVLRVPDQEAGLSPEEWLALVGPHRPDPFEVLRLANEVLKVAADAGGGWLTDDGAVPGLTLMMTGMAAVLRGHVVDVTIRVTFARHPGL
jgi:transcriptional regulator with XRE-family HTH domain